MYLCRSINVSLTLGALQTLGYISLNSLLTMETCLRSGPGVTGPRGAGGPCRSSESVMQLEAEPWRSGSHDPETITPTLR